MNFPICNSKYQALGKTMCIYLLVVRPLGTAEVLSFTVLTSADLCGMSALSRLLKFISPLVFMPKGYC